LRELEENGVVRRRPLDLPATGVAYELTEIGRELERPMIELGRWGLHFQPLGDVGELEPAALANAVRVIVHPPLEARLTVGLRSGGQSYALRIEDGWIAASRGEAESPDVTIEGEPANVLTMLVVGEAAEAGVEIGGSRRALKELRAMVALPDHLREATLAAEAEPATA